MSYSEYIHITDPKVIEEMLKVRANMSDWIKSLSGKVQKFGMKSGCFQRIHGFGGFWEKMFVGAYGYKNNHEFYKDKFKVIHKNITSECHLYSIRKGNKEAFTEWKEHVTQGIPDRCNLDGIIPLIFSEFPEGRHSSAPIANIKWVCIDGTITIRLAWFGHTRESWKVDERHKTILMSEYCRLNGE